MAKTTAYMRAYRAMTSQPVEKAVQTDHVVWGEPTEVASVLGVSPMTANGYMYSVWNFTGSDYGSIRKSQRDGKPSKDAKRLEEFLDKSPDWGGGELFRGISVDKEKFAELTTKGAIIDCNAGTASWSSTRKVGRSFSGYQDGSSIVFVHSNPVMPKSTSIKSLSQFGGEDEVLVSKDVSYRVTKVVKGKANEKGITFVYVDAV